MNRMQWKSRRNIIVVLGLIIFYLTIRVRNYEHKMVVFLPKVHPNEPWEFVADFSNMKYLNPTILDFSITDESGNYDHWHYNIEYSEKLSHWPHLPNYATAHFQVKASNKKDAFYIISEHRTCMLGNMYCCSVEPPRKEGLLRLYSMLFCPFAQRVRLVLKAKDIPHDIVNINLMNKPEWYSKIHPEVPALLDGHKIIVESLDICDYLDEKYPENPMYPAEPASKEKDKQIIQKIEPAITVFARCVFGKEEKTPEEWLKEFLTPLQPLEDELTARGTKYFGGQLPCMVDYMIWPWAERAGVIAMKLGAKLPIEDNHIPQLRKWRKVMREDPVASELYHGPDIFWRAVQAKLKNAENDYDSIVA